MVIKHEAFDTQSENNASNSTDYAGSMQLFCLLCNCFG